MYRKFRNGPIFEDFSPICPYLLDFRVGKYAFRLQIKFSLVHVFKRPIYIGKNQNPKNLGFLLYRLHCQKNP